MGLLYVFLLGRGDKRGWPIGVLAAFLAVFIYARQHIWGQVALNFGFLLLQFAGWWQWTSKENGEQKAKPCSLKRSSLLLLLGLWMVLTLAVGACLTYYASSFIWLDSVATTGSLIGQVLLVFKFIESWPVYLASDLVLVLLNAKAGLMAYSFMYLVYCWLAWKGWREWAQDMQGLERNDG